MQCPECGSEWKASNRIDLIQRCPFCGASLEKEAPRQITFTNAKEGVRYIVDNFGSDVIVDNEQFTKLLNKFMPKLKQERKVIVEAMNEGVCTTLYDATDQSEIDKCIAILQSIKILTQDACMAEKWACYAVETIVYALGWSVPMFGITPNIHMYQIPETVSHPWNQENSNEVWVQPDKVWVNPVESNGDTWDDKKQEVIEVSEEELNKPSHHTQDDFYVYEPQIFEQSPENDKSVEQQSEELNKTNTESSVSETPAEEQKEPVIESPVFEAPTEEAKEPVIESPVFEAPTEEAKESVIESPVFEAPTEEDKEPVIESPVFEAPTEEAKEPVIESPVFEAPTEESTEPVIESPVFEAPTEEAKEPVIESPVFETPVEESENNTSEHTNEQVEQNSAPQQTPFGSSPEQQYNPWAYGPWGMPPQQGVEGQQQPYNPWAYGPYGMPPQQGAEGKQQPYNPWAYGPWGMPPQQGAEGQQQPYNPWGMPPQPNAQQNPVNEPVPQPVEEVKSEAEKEPEPQPEPQPEPEPQPIEKETEPEPVAETNPESEAPFIPQPESTAKKNNVDIDQYMNAPWAVHNRGNSRVADVKPIDIPTNSTGTSDRTNGFSVSNTALHQETPVSAEPVIQTPAENHEPIHKVDLSSLNIKPSDEPISKPSMEKPSMETMPVVEIPIPQPETNVAPAEEPTAENIVVNIPEPSVPETSSTSEVFTKEDANKFTLNHIQIPEGVIRIDDEAFKDNQKIEAVALPKSLKEIGDSAFEGCIKLITINIPDGVTEIGKCAFKGCSSITSIKLPDSITRINAECFGSCEKLKDFKIPSSIQHISRHAFMNCASIVDIEIPDGIHGLAENIFSGCKSLQTIKVPESVSQIHKNCFSWCESLTTINLPEAVTEIAPGSFTGCEKLKTLDIPSRITKIGYGAFSKCSGLKSLTLPDTITEIEENAFLGCRSLVVYCSQDNAYIKRYCRLNRVRCKSIT